MGLKDELLAAVRSYPGSQLELAKRAGVVQPVIWRFAAGRGSVSLDTAEKLIEFFGMEITNKPKFKFRTF